MKHAPQTVPAGKRSKSHFFSLVFSILRLAQGVTVQGFISGTLWHVEILVASDNPQAFPPPSFVVKHAVYIMENCKIV